MRIDWWTVGLQAVNVLVLLWLLHRFLYQPVRRVLERRREQATRLLDEARASQAQAAAQQQALAAEREALAAARDRAEADAQAAAAVERGRLLAQFEAETAERARAARAALAAERQAAEAELAGEASALAVDIARRLLERVPAATVLGVFLDGACAELKRLGRGTAPDPPEEIELVSAVALDEAAQALCRDRLAAVVGPALQLRFSVDPALIAGLELHLPHMVVRNHWAQDLARVLEALHADVRVA